MNKTYLAYRTRSDTDIVLIHHGTKGQKWGIRKYQNQDGSLTPAGVRRYGTVDNMDRTRSRNQKVAIGVGVTAAVVAGTIVARKNRSLKKTIKINSAEKAASARKKKNTYTKIAATKAANKLKREQGILPTKVKLHFNKHSDVSVKSLLKNGKKQSVMDLIDGPSGTVILNVYKKVKGGP